MTNIIYYIDNIAAFPLAIPLLKASQGRMITPNKRTYEQACQVYDPSRITLMPKFNLFSEERKALKKADVVVMDLLKTEKIKFSRAKKVALFHGTYRVIGEDVARHLSDFALVLCNGPRQCDALQTYQTKYPLRTTSIGYIPFDYFIPKTDSTKETLLRKMGLHPHKKTILYTPARRRFSSWHKHALKIAEEINEDYNLIMRPHPNLLSEHLENEKQIRETLTQWFSTRHYHRLDKGELNYYECLCVADLIISDATSPTEESLYYDTPQLITETVTREEWQSEYEKEGVKPTLMKHLLSLFDVGTSFEKGSYRDWRHAVDTALSTADDYQHQRQTYFKYAFGDIKKGVTQYALNAIQDLNACQHKKR